ncbi:MAG: SDR family oxidoreductase [Patescibacteria group bacterium]
MDIKNKTIILTGAARIGQEIAKSLKEKGANLVMTYFNSPDEVGALGLVVKADVSRQKDVELVVKTAKERFGSVDCLVHMAAIYEKTDWKDLSEASWLKQMDIIAKSSFLFAKIAGDQMLMNQGDIKGKMVFFSDWSVMARPYKDYIVYNVAKASVEALVKSLAKELAPDILVNAIAPGPILKPPNLTDKENEEVIANTLLKKWGGAKEIAKGVCYLLDTDFVTGHILTIDGGRTIA